MLARAAGAYKAIQSLGAAAAWALNAGALGGSAQLALTIALFALSVWPTYSVSCGAVARGDGARALLDELAGGAKHEGDADAPAARGQAEDPSAPLLD